MLILAKVSQGLSASELTTSPIKRQKVNCQANIYAEQRHWLIIRSSGLLKAKHARPWSLILKDSPLLTLGEDADGINETLTAPVTGILTPYTRELLPGTRLQPGEHISDLIAIEDLQIKVAYGEKWSGIEPGQKLELLTPELLWQTRVSHIQQQALWLSVDAVSGNFTRLEFDISLPCEIK